MVWVPDPLVISSRSYIELRFVPRPTVFLLNEVNFCAERQFNATAGVYESSDIILIEAGFSKLLQLNS
ncbi:hypothetical protein D3C76_1556580 [compost metagenome]